jgi:hypothetical protein
MPVRFTSPSLGGQRDGFFKPGEWQIAVSFRHLYADDWFVGKNIDEAAAPFGKPLYLNINSLDVSVTYATSRRASITLTAPMSYGRHSRLYADKVRHEVSARGVGDINAIANVWIWNPDEALDGNVSLGLGIKAPTGNSRIEGDFFAADGSVSRRVVDQSIQLGDGGWGFIAQAQGYRHLTGRFNGYLFGSYLVAPKKKSSVPSPIAGVALSVPDVYSVRGGTAFALIPSRRLSTNLGVRMDGIPLRDVIGGGDDGFRRPGYTLYLDPGAAMRIGRQEVTLSVPIRLRQNFSRSLIDRERNLRGGGDLARYLVFAGYSVRL